MNDFEFLLQPLPEDISSEINYIYPRFFQAMRMQYMKQLEEACRNELQRIEEAYTCCKYFEGVKVKPRNSIGEM